MSENKAVPETDKNEAPTRKRVRHRKKLLYEKILKQMEFYFGDANLSKDRFLSGLVKVNPYVPIETFLTFNKIRTLTNSASDIAKALKKSLLLELSEDKTKIKRKTPMLPYDADSRTVYVESIPVTASREWLQSVFSDYGPVAYISLPKIKNTEKIKGFAFIEFSKAEDAQKCLQAFTKMGCKLPLIMPPEELSTIKMFSIDDSANTQNENKNCNKNENYEPPKKKLKKGKDRKLQKNLELKLDSAPDSNTEDKLNTPVEETKTVDVSSSKDEISSQDESNKVDEAPRKKKTRKRTAKERIKAKNNLGKNEAPKGALWGLQVLSKSEWKALRNKYLNLQRKTMKELKQKLRNNGHSHPAMTPAPPLELGPGLRPSSEDERPKRNTTVLQRVPGVFVKDELPEPCLDIKQTKQQIRSNVHIQYVDVKEGQSQVIMRFDTAEAATEYCNMSKSSRVLSGAEEAQQWERASGLRAPRLRGRTRLLRRAEAAASAPAHPQPTATHIRFDDDNS
ncbi:La-related protein 7 [Eumeta japonica]|uniref:La-related protein 7 n=1 Tax=Eumeta variegata TaxID=151549 RepID=A0A4C1S8D8_EUMVA|nr:La-related protein 7 [Eumeta japonica]